VSALHCTGVSRCLHVSTLVLTAVEATLPLLGLGAKRFDVRTTEPLAASFLALLHRRRRATSVLPILCSQLVLHFKLLVLSGSINIKSLWKQALKSYDGSKTGIFQIENGQSFKKRELFQSL
jgi:hypothetical protein